MMNLRVGLMNFDGDKPQKDEIIAVASKRWRAQKERAKKWGHFDFPPVEEYAERLLDNATRGFCCEYCGAHLVITADYPHTFVVSFDHKHPYALGGKPTMNNVAVCCCRCNLVKGTLTAETFVGILASLNITLREKYLTESLRGQLANKITRGKHIGLKAFEF